jgi:hypothetical protein
MMLNIYDMPTEKERERERERESCRLKMHIVCRDAPNARDIIVLIFDDSGQKRPRIGMASVSRLATTRR